VFWPKIAQAGENESNNFSRAKMLCKRAFQRSLIPKRSETASIGGFSSGFFKSKSSSGQDYDIREFCKQLDVKKRQAFEHELRRLRREGDETIAIHASAIKTTKPSFTQLRICFIHNAVPFIGFGFLDNLVMILVGDYIDSTFGFYFHISVLAAAGLGNTLSDVVGVFFGGYVELMADRMGLPQPKFSPQEADSIHARFAKNGGQAIGIIIGCLLGMFPLLFMDTSKYMSGRKDEKSDEQEEILEK